MSNDRVKKIDLSKIADFDRARKEIRENAEKILDALILLKEYSQAGLETQITSLQNATGLDRGAIFERIMLSGGTWGFPEQDENGDEFFKEGADPYDLENWMQSLRAVNDIIAEVEAISWDPYPRTDGESEEEYERDEQQ